MNLIQLITTTALQLHMDPQLALAVVKVESNYNTSAVGSYGEVGLMQIRPEYSRHTATELLNPKTNVKEGIRKLKEAKKHCKHQVDNTWVICFNKGVAGGSKLKYPLKDSYYKNIMKEYKEKTWQSFQKKY